MRKMMILALLLPLTVVAEEAKKPAEAPKAPAAAAPADKAAPAPKVAPAAEKAAGSELKVGTNVENKALVGAAEEFKIAADTKIWAWAKAVGVAADAKLTLSFSKGDKEAYRKELQAAGSPWRVNAYKPFRAGDAELASAKFKVEITK